MADIINRNDYIGEFKPEEDDDLIICRCEEVTKGEIRKAVHDGIKTVSELRRYLRVGMGLCQGQTCTRLFKNIMAKEMLVHPDSLEASTSRSPNRPIEMKIYASEVWQHDE